MRPGDRGPRRTDSGCRMTDTGLTVRAGDTPCRSVREPLFAARTYQCGRGCPCQPASTGSDLRDPASGGAVREHSPHPNPKRGHGFPAVLTCSKIAQCSVSFAMLPRCSPPLILTNDETDQKRGQTIVLSCSRAFSTRAMVSGKGRGAERGKGPTGKGSRSKD